MSKALQVKKQEMNSLLDKYEGEFQKALPSMIDVNTFTRSVMTMVTNSPKLLDCKPASFMGAVLQASQLGLVPDGLMGHAYIIPYKDQAQFQIGYKGLVQLARRTGKVRSVIAREVYEGDDFEYDLSEGIKKHKRDVEVLTSDDKITHFYARVMYTNGGEDFAVMTKKQIDFHKEKYSKGHSRSDSPWNSAYAAMGKKTVLIQALKFAELSPEVSKAVTLAESADQERPQNNSSSLVGTEMEHEFDVFEDVTDTNASQAREASQGKSSAALKQVG